MASRKRLAARARAALSASSGARWNGSCRARILDDALGAAQRLAENRIDTLLTHLGENVADRAEAEAVTKHYLDVLDRIRAARLPSEISVKLTQLGLDLDREFCYANLVKLIERLRAGSAPPQKVIWIDMEQVLMWTSRSNFYAARERQYPNVGVCVQAYLYRTEKDLECADRHGRRRAVGERRLQRAF